MCTWYKKTFVIHLKPKYYWPLSSSSTSIIFSELQWSRRHFRTRISSRFALKFNNPLQYIFANRAEQRSALCESFGVQLYCWERVCMAMKIHPTNCLTGALNQNCFYLSANLSCGTIKVWTEFFQLTQTIHWKNQWWRRLPETIQVNQRHIRYVKRKRCHNFLILSKSVQRHAFTLLKRPSNMWGVLFVFRSNDSPLLAQC